MGDGKEPPVKKAESLKSEVSILMPNPRWTHDRKLTGSRCGIVGVDEAGRGCLAGPVVAAAVVLPVAFFRDAKNRKRTDEMNDSKQFNENKREQLYSVIMEMVEKRILFGAFGQASIDEIESRNIVGATCWQCIGQWTKFPTKVLESESDQQREF